VCELLIEAAFGDAGAPEIIAVIHPDNEPSLRLFQSLGFKKIGTKEARCSWDGGHLIFRRQNQPAGAK